MTTVFKPCAVKWCDRKVLAKGLCRAHYQRARDGRDMDAPIQTKSPTGDLCSTDDCDRPRRYTGLCQYHYDAANRARKNADSRQWRIRNPEKVRDLAVRRWRENREVESARSKCWREANPDQHRANAARWREANAERAAENFRRWASENPAKARENYQRQRLKRRGRIRAATVGKVDFTLVLAEHGMVCHLCGGDIDSWTDLHFDHVVPLARGGEHSNDNLRPAHAGCNLRKGSSMPSLTTS